LHAQILGQKIQVWRDSHMKVFSLELPAMYGDHHVVEVRRILHELPGVRSVYASSAFRMVEVEYDEAAVGAEAIEEALSEAGYLGELPMPAEVGAGATNGKGTFFRHTAVTTGDVKSVSFAQRVPYQGRPLWPCPGIGALPAIDEEIDNG
jgi:copper chaperone CopZ